MIKYKYAKDISGNIIDIDNVLKTNKIKYICIGCEKELIAKLGNEREHHFSHKSNEEFCNSETYLHELSKKALYNHLLSCKKKNIPFIISLKKEKCLFFDDLNCELLKTEVNYDILKYYRNIYLEKYSDGYKPDILLTSNEKNLFIEIVVTHESTNEKKLNNKIIEIFIKNEKDIYEIINNGIQENNDKIKLFNFKKVIIDSTNCNEKNCNTEIGIFLLTNTGEVKLGNIKIALLTSLKNDKNIQCFYLNNKNFDISENCYNFVEYCMREKLNVKNCYICKYSSVFKYNNYGKNIFAIKCQKDEKDLLLGLKGIKCNYFITKI